MILAHVYLKSKEGRERIRKRLHMEGQSPDTLAAILQVGREGVRES